MSQVRENKVREANMYAKYHAKRDNSGNLERVNQKEVKGKLTPGDLVKGEFMQIRGIPKRLVNTLINDPNHPFVYVKVTKEEAEKIRESNSPENKLAAKKDSANENELLTSKVKKLEAENKKLAKKFKDSEGEAKKMADGKKDDKPKEEK